MAAGAAHAQRAVSPADFFSTGPDGDAADARDFMGLLQTAAPQLEREQARQPTPAFLIKGRHNPIDSLRLPSYSTVSVLRTSGALTIQMRLAPAGTWVSLMRRWET